ncbi:hypothetical protein FVR03_14895 [Pontibacter qinzhouensis]|uniref:Uncharacterized protein n=1 Tax=Pontibacter qinzhouensis TaxID=2603253 RepID=A0A5C8JJ97_9BACT|nr:hypothetical protein [Pontibacter qinzhouensis]TXK37688.1 hypothetical protein FVR03_14895 [Pontibacter qinzhouensis]
MSWLDEEYAVAANKWLTKHPCMQLHELGAQEVKCYGQKGQPAKDALPEKVEYYLRGRLAKDLEAWQKELFQ